MSGTRTTLGAILRASGGSIRTGPFGTALAASEYTLDGAPVISVGEVGVGALQVRTDTRRVPDAVVRRMPEYVLRGGDIVFGRKGAVDRSAHVKPAESGYFLGSDGIRLRLGSGVDSGYVAYWLQSAQARDWLTSHSVGTTMPTLTQPVLEALPVQLPDLGNQRVIRTRLSDVDSLIASLEMSIAKKRTIKQGLMQELLTGRTRLPGFARVWTTEIIASLARVIGGGTPSTRVPTYWGGNIPWFTPAEIAASGSGLVARSERSITPEGLARSGTNLLPAGTVLVTSRASIGNTAVAAVPVTTNQGFASLVPSSPKSTWFLYYWIQQNKAELESRSAGSTFLEISARKVAAIPIAAPSLDEQDAIGRVLQDADAEIEALERRLEATRAIKQGMMQELLTGRTRLEGKGAA